MIKIRNSTGSLRQLKQQVLRFLTDLSVPFSNNQSERDLAMMKVKQKISGYFYTSRGAEASCTILVFIYTDSQRDLNIFNSIASAI